MDEKVRELIARHLGVAQGLICDHVSFRELGADSLDLISLPISDQEAESCTSVADAIKLLSRRVEPTVSQFADAQG